ncbi:hypothetical protein VTO42DRAFT_195 [Malbranchea cinnamomea]
MHALSLRLLWLFILTITFASRLQRAQATEPKIDERISELLNEAERTSNRSLLWGPYRSNLYFGVRPRIPRSLLTGLLWAKVEDFQSTQGNFRYTCEQHEGMAGYGWDEYDIREGGQETIYDTGNTLDLTINFIKVPGGTHGGSWGARIKGRPRPDASGDQVTTLIFYVALEGTGNLEVAGEPDPLGFKSNVRLTGNTEDLGHFTIDITSGPKTNAHPSHSHPSYDDKPLDRTLVSSVTAPSEVLWHGKTGIAFSVMKQEINALIQKYGAENTPPPAQLFTIPHRPAKGNTHVVQKVFQGPFELNLWVKG